MKPECTISFLVYLTSFTKGPSGLYPPGFVVINQVRLEEIELPFSNMPYNSAVSQFSQWEQFNSAKASSRIFLLAQTMLSYCWNYWLIPIEFCSSHYGGDWWYDSDTCRFRTIDYELQWRMLFTVSQLLTTRCAPQGYHLLNPYKITLAEGAKVAAVMLMLGVNFDLIIDYLSRDVIKDALKTIHNSRTYIRATNYKVNYRTTINKLISSETSADNIYLLQKLGNFFEVYSDIYKFYQIISIEQKGVGTSFAQLDTLKNHNKHLRDHSIFSLTKANEETSSWYMQRELYLGHKKYYGYPTE
ncbi:hypothetical protein [Hymenobacter siberiensis]|uniref:hypothetical protein n=1 Tax=Hymenobacter siberiensis TaxID=2848396 RepID=UPI001C1E5FEE|nr:hypothetical protein [Hymenobacter siberiensis]MBU6122312.1 hypothetical protein [Hymenobacter siberiensis]